MSSGPPPSSPPPPPNFPPPPPAGWVPPVECPECGHLSKKTRIYCSTCRGPYYCSYCASAPV